MYEALLGKHKVKVPGNKDKVDSGQVIGVLIWYDMANSNDILDYRHPPAHVFDKPHEHFHHFVYEK